MKRFAELIWNEIIEKIQTYRRFESDFSILVILKRKFWGLPLFFRRMSLWKYIFVGLSIWECFFCGSRLKKCFWRLLLWKCLLIEIFSVLEIFLRYLEVLPDSDLRIGEKIMTIKLNDMTQQSDYMKETVNKDNILTKWSSKWNWNILKKYRVFSIYIIFCKLC